MNVRKWAMVVPLVNISSIDPIIGNLRKPRALGIFFAVVLNLNYL